MTARRGAIRGCVWAPKGFCGRDQACAFPARLSSKQGPGPRLAGTGPRQLPGASYTWAEPLVFIKTSYKWIPGLRLRGAGRHRSRRKKDEGASLGSLKVPKGQREWDTEPGGVGQVGGSRAGRRSRATRPACGRGPRMDASTTQGSGEQPDYNRMVGQMDGQPRLLWAPAPCPPVSSLASGLGGRDSAGLWQG